tara:strand:+ start:1259 stop:1549 length:291 start_codon:yes stop_codon:yes gene_type:complete
MNKKQNVQNYIENATANIVEDRAATKALLMSLMDYMKTGEDKHREFGTIAAKYLETLQRSNEQLVKLAVLLQKKASTREEITEEDRQELFDLINSN